MLKTLLKAVGLLACMAWFNLATAASMGGINVTSALGHPLRAEVSLSELGKGDQSTLKARLASVNEFKSAGLEFPYSLPKLNFEVVTRNNGDAYLKITSVQPVNEPFVTLLVELNWPSGKLLREYTFLLDPSGFTPEQPKMADVRPVEPMLPVAEPMPEVKPVEAAALPEAPMPAPVVAPLANAGMPMAEEVSKDSDTQSAHMQGDGKTKADAASAETVFAEPGKVMPAEQVKMEPLPSTSKSEPLPDSVLVEKGDTLGRIAEEIKPVDVSLERMLVAMYRANTKTFDGKNMNRIREGKILRIPESDEIAKVSQAAAVREIRAQVSDWQDYRQRLAAAQTGTPQDTPKQEAAGKISTAVAEKAPAVKESSKEVLRLSKGEVMDDKAAAGKSAKSKEEKQIAKADDKTAQTKRSQEEQKKIAKLESISKDVSKLVELKGQPDAKEAIPPAAAPKAAEAPKAGEVPPKPQPTKVVPAEPVPAGEEFDIMAWLEKNLTTLLDDPVILASIAGGILALGGAGYYFTRRDKGTQKKTTKKNDKAKVGEATGSWRTPVAPSPDTGDFTQSYSVASPAAATATAELDDVDPISEADLFLNFGRDVQAEDILKDALAKNPSNIQIKLKLLSIYVSRKDSNTFSKYAQEVKDSGDTAAWERAAVMGRELDPSNPTYGGVKGEIRQREQVPAGVDFDLGLDKAPVEATGNQVAAQDFKMDFDVTENQAGAGGKGVHIAKPSSITHVKTSAQVDATSILSREDLNAAHSASPMDFDISGILPGEAKNVPESSSMDFDLGNSSFEMPAAAKGGSSSSLMDFDVSSSNIESTALINEPAKSSSGLNFDDLVFEIPTSSSKPVEEAPKAKPVAMDDAMPFSIDFPTSDHFDTPSGKGNESSKLDIDFGDININMEDDSPIAHEGGEGKDEQWHEVATKLDLAKAYQEMGDADGAREILEEVKRDGDDKQRESADRLLSQITA